MTDWIGDATLTRVEKLARFRAGDPQPTRGPMPDISPERAAYLRTQEHSPIRIPYEAPEGLF